MAISFVSAGNNSRATNGNVTPGLPPGWIPNDIFICVIASRDNVNSTMPPGWIAIDPGTNNGVNLRTTTLYKIAISGDTDPIVTHPGGNSIEATIVSYRNVDTISPFDIIGTISINPSSTTVIATSITTLTDTSLVIFTGSIYSRSRFGYYSGTPTPIERIDVPNTINYPSTFLTDFIMSPVGNTGNRTCIATVGGISNGLIFALRPATATITFITDPSNANIYINGILQPINTSTSIPVMAGDYTTTLYKAGYYPYAETVTGLLPNQIVKVATILTQIANITDNGIVICTGLNISTCPISPITCPILITPLDYINLITTITSTSPLSLTVRFIYMIDGTQNYTDVPVNLAIGNNIVYAFPLNMQYPPNAILSLDNVILI
jgi:hypothetical protein